MIWQTWRQHRAEAALCAALLGALVAAMLVVGTIARDRAQALGLPTCAGSQGGCGNALDALHRDFHTIPPFTAALVAVPLLAGMFWAAPLVSREYEAGTHRLAWTQSVSPLRWIVTKIVLIFAVLSAAALGLGLLATWTLDPLIPSFGGRYNSTWYDTQGLVPAACMLFALSLGVAASALIGRTIPAMAVTLVGYAAARIPVHWFRVHFAPLETRSFTAPLSNLLSTPYGAAQDAFATNLAPGDWVQHQVVTGPSGQIVPAGSPNLNMLLPYCPNLSPRGSLSRAAVQACAQKVTGINLHETVTYQPAGHFWLVQAVETAIFAGAAAVLITVAVLAVTRRRHG
jgi:hypothetical protein